MDRNAVGGGSKKWNWPQSPPHPLLLWHFSVHSSFSLSSSRKLTSCDGAESEYESENSASYRSKIRNWRNKGIDNFTFLHSCSLVLRILFLYSTWKSEGCRGNRSFSSEKYWNWTFWTKMFCLRRGNTENEYFGQKCFGWGEELEIKNCYHCPFHMFKIHIYGLGNSVTNVCCKTAGVQLGRVYLKWHLLASQSRQQLVVRREL